MTTQYLIFSADVTEHSVNSLMSCVIDAVNDKEISDIFIGFSSGGGQVNPGVSAHHFIKSIPKPITMHAMGAVNSIALCIFMAGAKRYAVAGSSFQFHGVGRTLNNASYGAPALRDILSMIANDEVVLSAIWKTHMELGSAEAARLFEGEHVYDCHWALSKGLIEDIRDFHIPFGAIGHVRNIYR